MNRPVLLLIVVWCVAILVAVLKGINDAGPLVIHGNVFVISLESAISMSIVAFLLFFVGGFSQRASTPHFSMMFVVWLLDAIFGKGSTVPYERFLRLDLLFAVIISVYGIVGLVATQLTTPEMLGSSFSIVCLACGIGTFSAYILSRKFPPTLW